MLERNLLNQLLTHIKDAVYFKDRESRFTKISDAMAARFGLNDPEEAVGKTDFDFFSEVHAREAFKDEQNIIKTGEPLIDIEERETWPDGHETWVLTSKMPLLNKKGEIIGICGISRNITERKQAEMALRRSEANLRRTLRQMESELLRAQIVQRTLLPASPPQHERIKTGFRYFPVDGVSGDFFSFFSPPSGGLCSFIGDLTGHGVSAALYMTLVKFLTDHLYPEYFLEPKEFLTNLNLQLLHEMPSSFITAQYCYFECCSNGVMLHTAGAGHPNPMVFHRKTKRIKQLQSQGNGAIGLLESFATRTVQEELKPGDRVFIYTDGITEAMSPSHKFFGQHQLSHLLHDCQTDDLESTLDCIIQGLQEFTGQRGFDDDIALIGFEACG
ncbi:SpoIIE family protein phosphatase [Candidatus Sumerlaeota bacterium]|nr:SpoIIE family protein phosphatase [Candidatus Sumerlaeota bacterium]